MLNKYNYTTKPITEFTENDTIYICAASVGYLMTRYLPDNIKFTVVTNSIIVAEELLHRDNIETFVIGGKLHSRGYMADAAAIDFVKNMRFDIEFMLAPTRAIVTSNVAISTPNIVIARLTRNFLNPIYLIPLFFLITTNTKAITTPITMRRLARYT